MSLWRMMFSVGLSAALFFAGAARQAYAQSDLFVANSDLDMPLAEYLAKAGPDVKLIEVGKLKIDGHTMKCGTKPTVIDPQFESWAGAYPEFVILNLDRLKGLSTPVKLFIYAHECGHTQPLVSRSEEAADCFGVKRGRRYGWLKEEGLAQVCDFISTLKGDADHAAGPKRCSKMRMCYIDASPRAARN